MERGFQQISCAISGIPAAGGAVWRECSTCQSVRGDMATLRSRPATALESLQRFLRCNDVKANQFVIAERQMSSDCILPHAANCPRHFTLRPASVCSAIGMGVISKCDDLLVWNATDVTARLLSIVCIDSRCAVIDTYIRAHPALF